MRQDKIRYDEIRYTQMIETDMSRMGRDEVNQRWLKKR